MTDDLRMVGAIERGRPITIFVDDRRIVAYEGESVAAALLAAGHRTFRDTARTATPRGYFCGMGVCHDCLIVVDGQPNMRACVAVVRDGLQVKTQRGLGAWDPVR